MPDALAIGALQGGGLVLGYRCPSHCRHCLYGCGPHRRDGEGDLEAVLDLLAARAPGARYHVGGGEPFLDLERLERAIAGLAGRGLALDYVETNAAWVRDADHAAATLERLARAGLDCVLVSLSPFHAEFVPLARTLALVAAAEAVLPGGAFVWIPELRHDLAGQAPGQRLDLDAFLAARGDDYARRLAARYGLVPAGRAGRFLHDHGVRRPWREVAGAAECRARLRDTTHFHVDLAGQYVPGLCAGLVLPLAEVPGEIDLARYPILAALVRGGPAALVELALPQGFTPEETYASACDLCTHARFFLHGRGDFAELGPPGFYDPRSVAH
jgi:hypothetical protein